MAGETTGNPVVDAIGALGITGDIVPRAWLRTIRDKRGKPYWTVIFVLAHVVAWHQPVLDRKAKRWKPKFSGDRFRFERGGMAKEMNEKPETISAAVKFAVEKLNALERQIKDVVIAGRMCRNVVYLTPVPEVIAQLSGLEEAEGGRPGERGDPGDQGDPSHRSDVTPENGATSPQSVEPRHPSQRGSSNIVQQQNNNQDNTTTTTGGGGGGGDQSSGKTEAEAAKPEGNGDGKLWKNIQNRIQELEDRWHELGKGNLKVPPEFAQQAHDFCKEEDWVSGDLLHVISTAWVYASTQKKPEKGHDRWFFCRKMTDLKAVFRRDKRGDVFVVKAAQELGHEPKTLDLEQVREEWATLLADEGIVPVPPP